MTGRLPPQTEVRVPGSIPTAISFFDSAIWDTSLFSSTVTQRALISSRTGGPFTAGLFDNAGSVFDSALWGPGWSLNTRDP